MTTYLSHSAVERLSRAQADIDQHVAAGVDGRCLTCGEVQPCRALSDASETFAGYRQLPQRRPGHASRALPARRRGAVARPDRAAGVR